MMAEGHEVLGPGCSTLVSTAEHGATSDGKISTSGIRTPAPRTWGINVGQADPGGSLAQKQADPGGSLAQKQLDLGVSLAQRAEGETGRLVCKKPSKTSDASWVNPGRIPAPRWCPKGLSKTQQHKL
jgi:hypothetical protein